jgi:hypothetical protein
MLIGAFIYANITAVQHSPVTAGSHLNRKLSQITFNIGLYIANGIPEGRFSVKRGQIYHRQFK